MTCLNYIKETYKVPADIGRCVVVDGAPGIIVGSNGPHLKVLFDADKPNHFSYAHPTWRVEYGGMGKIRKMTRAQKRYQDYLHSECNESFAEWLGVK